MAADVSIFAAAQAKEIRDVAATLNRLIATSAKDGIVVDLSIVTLQIFGVGECQQVFVRTALELR